MAAARVCRRLGIGLCQTAGSQPQPEYYMEKMSKIRIFFARTIRQTQTIDYFKRQSENTGIKY
jgi:hypothetical protein